MERSVQLRNGEKIVIRSIREDDLEQSLAFFRDLPPNDRIYLRRDVTRRDVVEKRIRDCLDMKVLRLVAVNPDGRIVADGSLESAGESWKDHVAELRLIVAAGYQRKSLGMLLARELYLQGVSRQVEEVVARIMRPQAAALKIVERLGFTESGVLKDYVKDAEGRKHDLIVMRCELQKLLGELENYFSMSDWQRAR